AARSQLLPSSRLAHTSPFAVPKYTPSGSRRSVSIPSRTDSSRAPGGSPLAFRCYVAPRSFVEYTAIPGSTAVRSVFLAAGLRVVLDPRVPAVGRRVHAADADADLHLLGIVRIDRDRVQAHTAEAGHPLRARWLIVERLVELPRLAAVLTLPKRGRLGAGPHDVRRLHMTGLDMPRLRERAV